MDLVELNTNCNYNEAFYLQAASWSPDDSTVYVATTGYKPNAPRPEAPACGAVDAAIAYPATQTSVTHTWINYTGCDSLYSTAADASTAYFGGHSGGPRTRTAVTPKDPAPSPHPAWKGCPQLPGC